MVAQTLREHLNVRLSAPCFNRGINSENVLENFVVRDIPTYQSYDAIAKTIFNYYGQLDMSPVRGRADFNFESDRQKICVNLSVFDCIQTALVTVTDVSEFSFVGGEK
jgi:hypothetical protein